MLSFTQTQIQENLSPRNPKHFPDDLEDLKNSVNNIYTENTTDSTLHDDLNFIDYTEGEQALIALKNDDFHISNKDDERNLPIKSSFVPSDMKEWVAPTPGIKDSKFNLTSQEIFAIKNACTEIEQELKANHSDPPFELVGKARKTFTQNYVKMTAKTCANLFLECQNREIASIISAQLKNYPHFPSLEASVRSYVEKHIAGKNLKQSGRQYQVQNIQDLERKFHCTDRDKDPKIIAVKQVVLGIFVEILRSNTFREWMMTKSQTHDQTVRQAYINKEYISEIVKKYQNPKYPLRFK